MKIRGLLWIGAVIYIFRECSEGFCSTSELQSLIMKNYFGYGLITKQGVNFADKWGGAFAKLHDLLEDITNQQVCLMLKSDKN